MHACDYTPPTDLLTHWQRHARLHFPALCRPRAADSHKGSHGTLAVVGGAQGMSGAIVLSGSAALINGCGKVWLGFAQPQLPLPWLPQQPEIMLATADELCRRSDIDVWVVGCGLGQSAEAAALLQTLWHQTRTPLLLDADALNLLAANPLPDPPAQLVLTPHPAEAARLLHSDTASVQANRTQAAQQLARHHAAWVVLKGRHSVVVSPGGHVQYNPSGNPGLATAGSGDVLSGIIGSLLAQGIPVEQAVAGGVWLHGAAADLLAAAGCGPIGLTAGEIAPAARRLRNLICG